MQRRSKQAQNTSSQPLEFQMTAMKVHDSPESSGVSFEFNVALNDASAEKLKAAEARAEQAASELLELDADEKAKAAKLKEKKKQRKAKTME